MYCPSCQKEVVIIGIPPGTATDAKLASIRRDLEQEGKLVLFNPPPFGPHSCPICGSQLDDSETTDTA